MRTPMLLSNGCTARAVGRDFPTVEAAEAHARAYLMEEPDAEFVNLFLAAPGCVPVLLWKVVRA